LNLLDDRRPDRRDAALGLLAALERMRAEPSSDAARIGITGAPGAGKSTLLDALIRRLRAAGTTVGVVAVDPSSRVSGGALLGDRARMRAGAGDRGVFLRSMAARERLGGVADATWPSMAVLAAVFDVVFVETVGVGQSEADVSQLVDTLLFVAQPGAGDVLQFMKAGILEHPDVFAVNKADLGALAERTANELAAGVSMGAQVASAWRAPVLLVSARDGRGIDALVDALAGHRAHLVASGELGERRRRARIAYVVDSLERRYGSYGVERVGGRDAIQARAGGAAGAGFELARVLGCEIETALGRPR